MRMFKNVWSIMLAILLVAVCIVIFLPVTLIFTEGENGEMTIWNWIGLAYAVLVVVVLKYLYKNGNGN
jgi:Ca2+/Na+ antiporter